MLRGAIALVALCLAALTSANAQSDSVEAFYRGRNVTILVGYPPGGGYDLYARMISRYLSKYIPGNPTIIVQNMPGAGSLVSVNYLYNNAPKDGTIFGIFAFEMPMMAILGYNDAVKFDVRKLTWLGTACSSERDPTLFFVRKDKLAKIQDAMGPGGKEILIGATAGGSGGNEWATLIRDVLGVNIRIVPGYRDSPTIYLAVDRNEVDGRSIDYSAVRAAKPEWLEPGSAVHAVLQVGRPTRSSAFPDVPTAAELVKTDRQRGLIEIADLSSTIARPFAGPPDVPPERAKALRKAFMDVLRDPALLEEADKLKVEISPVDGEEVLRRIERLASAPPELLAYMKKIRTETMKQ